MKNHVIVHSTYNWMAITENWILEQVKQLPFEQIMLADYHSQLKPYIIPAYYKEDIINNPFFKLAQRAFAKVTKKDLYRYWFIRKINKPVILISHFGTKGFSDLGLMPYKHITRFYGHDMSRVLEEDLKWKVRYKKLFKECDAFLTEGPYMKNELIKLGCPQHKIHVNYLGTNLTSNFSIRQYNPNDPLNLLIPSSITEKKGIIYSLEAINTLKINFPNLKFHIYLVGDTGNHYPPDRQYKKIIMNFLHKSNLVNHTTLTGYLSKEDLISISQSCHIGLHPSITPDNKDAEGGYPVVLLDLMATGLPFITTNHCDIPEVVNKENGYVCNEKSSDEIYQSLVDIINNPEKLTRKSEISRKTIEEKFNWKILGKDLTNIINKIICK